MLLRSHLSGGRFLLLGLAHRHILRPSHKSKEQENSQNNLFHNEERPAVFGQPENNFIIDLFFERTSDIIKLYII